MRTSTIAALVLLLACCGIASAAEARQSTEACPLGAPPMEVTISRDHYSGTVGDPVVIAVSVQPPRLPPGFYMTNLVTQLSGPEGGRPEVLSGVPETTITCPIPGEYIFRFMVNLVAKSSCAGAKSATLAEREITLSISE